MTKATMTVSSSIWKKYIVVLLTFVDEFLHKLSEKSDMETQSSVIARDPKNLLAVFQQWPNDLKKDVAITMEPLLQPQIANINTLIGEFEKLKGVINTSTPQDLMAMLLKLEVWVMSAFDLQYQVYNKLRDRKELCSEHGCDLTNSEYVLTDLVDHLLCARNEIIAKRGSSHLRYNKFIEDKLYPADILDRVKAVEGYGIYTTRLKKDSFIDCFLCDYKMPLEKIHHFWPHVSSIRHMRKLDFHHQKLSKYHEFWMTQFPKNQEIQLIYNYVDDEIMQCVNCGTFVPYCEVLPHLPNCNKKRQHTGLWYKRKQIEGPPEFNIIGLEILYCDLPKLDIDGVYYPIAQRVRETIKCLICNIEVKDSLKTHFDIDLHVYNLSLWCCTQRLKQYHNVWADIPAQFQLQQIYFTPETGRMKCIVCHKSVKYHSNNIVKHLVKSTHIEYAQTFETDADSLLEQRSNLDLSLPYSLFTVMKLFKALPRKQIDDVEYPIMIWKRPQYVYCLLCWEPLMNTIKMHMKLQTHQEADSDTSQNTFLQKYHEIWSSLPEHLQTHLVCYKKKRKQLQCELCSIRHGCELGALLYHLNDVQHLQKYELFKKENYDLPTKEDVGNEHQNQDNCEMFQREITESTVIENTNYEHQNQEKREMSIPGNKKSSPKPIISNKLKNQASVQTKAVSSLPYTTVTMKKLFEGLPTKKVGNIEYPVMQKVVNGIQCIICSQNINQSPEEHLNSSGHQYIEGDINCRTFFQKHHKLWSSLSDKYQQQQVFYRRQKKRLLCLLCNISHTCELLSLVPHLISCSHEEKYKAFMLQQNSDNGVTINEVVNNELATKESIDHKEKTKITNNTTLPYANDIMKNLFEGLPSKRINNIEFPMMQKVQNGIYCFFCNKTIKQGVKVHLNTPEHRHIEANPFCVKLLQKHHEVWSAVPEYLQKQQMFYSRKSKRLECQLCNELHNYEQQAVLQHLNGDTHREKYELMLNKSFGSNCTPLLYSDETLKELFNDVPFIIFDNIRYPMMKTVQGGFYCFFCSIIINDTIDEHIYMHQQTKRKLTPDKFFLKYHKIWSSLPRNFQLHQVWYKRFNPNGYKLYCEICELTHKCQREVLLTHLKSKQHQKNLEIITSTTDSDKSKTSDILSNLFIDFSLHQSEFFIFNSELDEKIYIMDTIITHKVSNQCSNVDKRTTSSLHNRHFFTSTLCKNLFEDSFPISTLYSEDFYKLSITTKTNVRQTQDENCKLNIDGAKTNFKCDSRIGKLNIDLAAATIQCLSDMTTNTDDLYSSDISSSTTPSNKSDIDYETTSGMNNHHFSNNFLNYDSEVMDSIYENILSHYSIKLKGINYPMIQKVGPYKHCLVCTQSLSSELFHCNSEEHIRNINNPEILKLLEYYHNVFAQLSVKYQMHQKYFRKESKLKCILCSMLIPYSPQRVVEHVDTVQHMSKQQIFESDSSSTSETSPKRNYQKTNKAKVIETHIVTSNSNKYKELLPEASTSHGAKKTLSYTEENVAKFYGGLERYTLNVNLVDYFIFRRSVMGVRCILCCDSPVLNPSEHVQIKNHLQQTNIRSALNNLQVFHDNWMSNITIQKHQYYIIQKFCHLCREPVSDCNIQKHVSTKGHLKNVDSIETRSRNSDMLGGITLKIYTSVDAVRKINVLNVIKENNGDAHHYQVPAGTLRKLGKSRDVAIEGGTKRDTIEELTNDNKSESKAIPEISLNYISWIKETVYHDLGNHIITVDEISYPYIRRTWHGISCILCYDQLIDDIEAHINSTNHIDNSYDSHCSREVANFHNFWLEFISGTEQFNQIYIINNVCVLCNTSNLDFNSGLLREHISLEAHKANQDLHDNKGIQNCLGLNDKFEYCKEVENSLYKGLEDYWADYGIIRVNLLRNTIEGIRCILCNDAGVSDPKLHFEGHSHQLAMNDSSRLERVWNFHKTWQSMTPEAQMHQQYVILMLCVVCDKKINVNTAEVHISTRLHSGNISLYKLKSASVKAPARIQHLTKECTIDKKSKLMIDQLPCYLASHIKLLNCHPTKPNQVECTCCLRTFVDIMELRHHLFTKSHCSKSSMPQYYGRFLCEPCHQQLNSEKVWLEHLRSNRHSDYVNLLSDTRKSKLTEHYCTDCKMVIFGDALSVLRHVPSPKKKNAAVVDITLNPLVMEMLSSQKVITDTAERLVMEVEEGSKESMRNVNKCCTALENAVRHIYPKCRVYPFGSRITGLGTNKSDLDVFLDIGEVYNGHYYQSPTAQGDIVDTVGTELLHQREHFTKVNMVRSARTPIVQVVHLETKIDCDLSFRHGLSVENTNFIKFCLELQPVAKPALLFLKDWLSKTALPPGILSSYAFTLMFIYFMQVLGFLLPVAAVRHFNRSHGPFIDDWEVLQYNVPVKMMQNYIKICDLPLPLLLEKFFDFYTSFNYNQHVICPLLGRTVRKHDFTPKRQNLPPEMYIYVQKTKTPYAEHLRNRTPICIQDPFDLSHNVAKGCSEMFLNMFRNYCKLSKTALSALLETERDRFPA